MNTKKPTKSRLNRLEFNKKIESQFSKEIVFNYKSKEQDLKSRKTLLSAYSKYKQILDEIENMKNKKEEIEKNKEAALKAASFNEKLREDYEFNKERSRKEFEVFLKERQREALSKLKEEQRKSDENEEEMRRKRLKKEVRQREIQKSREKVNFLRSKFENERENEVNDYITRNINENQSITQVISQAYHMKGNKIDYSTTKFHSISIYKHGFTGEDNDFNANHKAELEKERLELKRRSKEKRKKSFEEFIDEKSYEAMKEIKTKENLKKLEEELRRINKMRSVKIGLVSNEKVVVQVKSKSKGKSIGKEYKVKRKIKDYSNNNDYNNDDLNTYNNDYKDYNNENNENNNDYNNDYNNNDYNNEYDNENKESNLSDSNKNNNNSYLMNSTNPFNNNIKNSVIVTNNHSLYTKNLPLKSNTHFEKDNFLNDLLVNNRKYENEKDNPSNSINTVKFLENTNDNPYVHVDDVKNLDILNNLYNEIEKYNHDSTCHIVEQDLKIDSSSFKSNPEIIEERKEEKDSKWKMDKKELFKRRKELIKNKKY